MASISWIRHAQIGTDCPSTAPFRIGRSGGRVDSLLETGPFDGNRFSIERRGVTHVRTSVRRSGRLRFSHRAYYECMTVNPRRRFQPC
ncbi:hypothetical protein D8S78_22230 [Natrialba swarupiae]|nr:hypothetical protein [Natrialba swarupiae]